MRARLTIQELEAFIHVADTLSFREAAARSFVSQSALSKTIVSAETKLGTRLFDRNTRRVELTGAGTELVPIARRIVYELRDSLSDLSEFVAGRKGHFTIATLPAIAASILPDSMQAFLEANPDVTISLQSISALEVLSMVEDGSADVGVAPLPPAGSMHASERFAFRPFIKDELMLMCRDDDPLARRPAVSWTVFTERPYIANGPRSSLRPLVDQTFADAHVAPDQRYESMNLPVTARMVAAGLGIAVIPKLGRNLVNCAGLAFVPLTDPVVCRDIGIVTRKGRSLSGPVNFFVNTFLTAGEIKFAGAARASG